MKAVVVTVEVMEILRVKVGGANITVTGQSNLDSVTVRSESGRVTPTRKRARFMSDIGFTPQNIILTDANHASPIRNCEPGSPTIGRRDNLVGAYLLSKCVQSVPGKRSHVTVRGYQANQLKIPKLATGRRPVRRRFKGLKNEREVDDSIKFVGYAV